MPIGIFFEDVERAQSFLTPCFFPFRTDRVIIVEHTHPVESFTLNLNCTFVIVKTHAEVSVPWEVCATSTWYVETSMHSSKAVLDDRFLLHFDYFFLGKYLS